MRIVNNIMAMNTQRQLQMANTSAAQAMERLSSGLRVNRAADDAAGLAISETMRAQIRGLNQASRNAQDGISLIQTAEGALNEVHSKLHRIRVLVIQAANGTYTGEGTMAAVGNGSDRDLIRLEVFALMNGIYDIANNTEFNTMRLLDGTIGSIYFHIGANSNQNMAINMPNIITGVLGGPIGGGISPGGMGICLEDACTIIDPNIGSGPVLGNISNVVNFVSSARANLGAWQNRLQHTIRNVDAAAENMQAAESRIRDADMAREIMGLTKQNILQQAGTSMLQQANVAPQMVLQLLQ